MTRPGELARAWKASGLADVVDDMLTIRMEFANFADQFRAPRIVLQRQRRHRFHIDDRPAQLVGQVDVDDGSAQQCLAA